MYPIRDIAIVLTYVFVLFVVAGWLKFQPFARRNPTTAWLCYAAVFTTGIVAVVVGDYLLVAHDFYNWPMLKGTVWPH